MSNKHWEAYFNAIRQQDLEKAKTSLEHLCDMEQDNPQVYLKLGDIHQKIGTAPQAIAAYHKSAWILRKQGYIQKALALYKVILRLDSYNEEALKLSKQLMIELEGLKKPKTATPYLKGHFEGKKPEAAAQEISQEKKEKPIHIPSLFACVPPDEIIQLIKKIPLQEYSPGQVIIEEGDSGDSLFLITSGSAKVIAHILGKEMELATLSPGDVFGEVAFLTGRSRTASVVVLDQLEVIELNRVFLEGILETYPDVLKMMNDIYHSHAQDTIEKVKSKLEMRH
jgi:tetratricopeptide (TPR) repeat protein